MPSSTCWTVPGSFRTFERKSMAVVVDDVSVAGDLDALVGEHRDVAVLDVRHVAAVFEEGSDVAGEEAPRLAGVHDQRVVPPCAGPSVVPVTRSPSVVPDRVSGDGIVRAEVLFKA
jgi:hypothetical protein